MAAFSDTHVDRDGDPGLFALSALPPEQRQFFEGLRAKWATNPVGHGFAGANPVVLPPDLDEEAAVRDALGPEEIERQKAALQRLDRIRVCQRCQGLGIIKYNYNFQTREENCGECDGEGTIIQESTECSEQTSATASAIDDATPAVTAA